MSGVEGDTGCVSDVWGVCRVLGGGRSGEGTRVLPLSWRLVLEVMVLVVEVAAVVVEVDVVEEVVEEVMVD